MVANEVRCNSSPPKMAPGCARGYSAWADSKLEVGRRVVMGAGQSDRDRARVICLVGEQREARDQHDAGGADLRAKRPVVCDRDALACDLDRDVRERSTGDARDLAVDRRQLELGLLRRPREADDMRAGDLDDPVIVHVQRAAFEAGSDPDCTAPVVRSSVTSDPLFVPTTSSWSRTTGPAPNPTSRRVRQSCLPSRIRIAAIAWSSRSATYATPAATISRGYRLWIATVVACPEAPS